jgi:hypothetical protein
MDAERREWLETLIAACERILARSEEEGHDPGYRSVMGDVADLLARLKVELHERLRPDAPSADGGPA